MSSISKKKTEIAVGLFAIITIAILFVVLFVIADERGIFQKKYTITAIFNDVGGLEVGSTVYLAGVEVGVVREIEILGKERVEVAMSIDKDVQKWMTQDSVARIASFGLLGGRHVNISVGSGYLPIIEEGGQITETKSLFEPIEATEKIIEKTLKTFDDLKATAEDIRRLSSSVSEAGEDIRELTSSVSEAVEDARNFIRDTHDYTKKIFGDTGLYVSLKKTIGNISKIGESLAESIPEMTQRSEEILRNIEEISKDIRDVNIGERVKSITDEMQRTFESIQQLTKEASRELEEAEKVIDGIKGHWFIRRYLEPEIEIEEKPISISIRESFYSK